MEEEAGPSFSGLKTMQLNDQKAGMEGLDKEAINKIIYENSKGTPYFTHQKKRQKSIDSKVHELQEEMKIIRESDRKKSLREMDLLCATLENGRDLSRSIVHIDMDAFYAAVEMRDNPDFKDKPIAVGSLSMLSTSNYHARKYGVRAAMPGFIAKKLCPDLIIVPYNFKKYYAVSKEMCKIVAEYDSNFSAPSLDEVYLDLTEYINTKHQMKMSIEDNCPEEDSCNNSANDESGHSSNHINDEALFYTKGNISNELRDKMAYEIVEEIRQRIHEITKLTASAGIAPNTMLAKVCSDQNKPNGQYQIKSTVEDVKSFISTLPVKKISGIGPVQGQILNSIGIVTCADMWSKRDLINILFSANSMEFYMEVALGIGSTTVKRDYVRKSVGNEQTFKEIYKLEELHKKCEELCNDLMEDLKPLNMLGKVIVLKIKTTDFKTRTRNCSLKYYTADPEIIKKAAKTLLDIEIAAVAPKNLKLRLMGVRMCKLKPENSVSTNSKQQISIKKFLREREYACPVCLDRTFTDKGLYNEHVKICIREPELVEEGKNRQDFINDLCVGGMDCYPDEGITTSDDLLFSSAAEKASLSSYLSELNSSDDDCDHNTYSYVCPICHNLLSNLKELNAHMDICLNRETIKEILSSEAPGVAFERDYVRKSVGNEQTFKEIYEPEELHKKCDELCNDLMEDLKPLNMLGKVIVLKIKTTDFQTRMRNHSLKYYTADPEIIKKAAKKLLDAEISAAAPQPLKLTLMDVRMSELKLKDSISTNSKQQISIKKFLSSKIEETEKLRKEKVYRCPVCLESTFRNKDLYKEHIYSCTGEPFGKEKNRQDLINDLCVGGMDCYPDKGIKTSDDLLYSAAAKKAMMLDAHLAELNSSDDDCDYYEPIPFYTCPVCQNLSLHLCNIKELNAHMDDCLNRETIEEIQFSELPGISKRKISDLENSSKCKKGSKKVKTIDEYFQ